MRQRLHLFLGFAVLFLVGCQNVTDQVNNQIAGKMMETASGGKIKMDANKGQIQIQGDDGSVVNIAGDDKNGVINIAGSNGEKVTIGGNEKDGFSLLANDGTSMKITGNDQDGFQMNTVSADGTNNSLTMTTGTGKEKVPSDMPVLDNGSDYSTITANGSSTVSYLMASTDLSSTCGSQTALVEKAGWSKGGNNSSIVMDTAAMYTYTKGKETMMVNCTVDKNVSIVLTKTASAN